MQSDCTDWGVNPGAHSSVWGFCKLLDFGVLLNRHGGESVPGLQAGCGAVCLGSQKAG